MAYSIKKQEVIKYQPEALKTFNLHAHEWIDNLNFTFKPEDFLNNAAEYVSVAKDMFAAGGWNGQGEVELMWVPPFVLSSRFSSGNDALGFVVWHVKQDEDGISWLLTPPELRLSE